VVSGLGGHDNIPTEEQHTTGCTLDSSCRTSLACKDTQMINFNSAIDCQTKEPTRSHSRRTSSSANCLQVIKLSIHPSRVGMDPGSLVGDRRCGSGDRAVSISMLLSIASGVLSWLKRRGQLGEGRSREKTTEFVDGRRYRGGLKNKEIYAPDDNSIKRQFSQDRFKG
jgi:hypothetical protein